MVIPLIVFGVGLFMVGCELLRPGRPWPRVAGWWLRAALLNGFQVGMVFVAGVAWDGWMLRHRPWSADCLGVAGGAVVGYLTLTFVYYWRHRFRHQSDFLWRWFHQVHHSPQRIEVIRNFYKHPHRNRRQHGAVQRGQLPRGRPRAGGSGLRHAVQRAGRAVLSLERAHAALAGLSRAAAGEPLRPPPGGAPFPQLRRPATVGHAIRHLPQPAPLAGPVWLRPGGRATPGRDAGGQGRQPASGWWLPPG